MDQHNYTAGRESFERAIALDPGYANGHANLGISFFSLGKFDTAAAALQTALKHDSNHLHALYTTGLLYHNQGREYDRALATFERVAAADPDDPLVRYYIGRTRAKLGHGEAAVAEFRRAIELDPANVSAYYAMASQFRALGREADQKAALETFTLLSRAGNEGVSSSYQGQGKYAEAVTDMGDGSLRREDVAVPLAFASAIPAPRQWEPSIAAAAAVDADNDGLSDLVISSSAGNGLLLLHLFANRAGEFTPSETWSFSAQSMATAAAPAAVSDLLFGDCDADGDLDMLVTLPDQTLFISQDSGRFAASRVVGKGGRRSVFSDVDHDGDLDALILGESGPQLLHNDGTATFSDYTETAGLKAATPGSEAVFSDFDSDRDVDFLVQRTDGSGFEVYSNNRDGTFSDIAPNLGLDKAAAADVAVGDFGADGHMDIITVGGAAGSFMTLYTSQRGRSFVPQTMSIRTPSHQLRTADLDNDGDLDLALVSDAGIHFLARVGEEFAADSTVLRRGRGTSQMLLRDFDADGDIDLWADGELNSNQTAGGSWISVRLQGVNSNPHGIGAKVEAKTTRGYQKRELRGGSRDAAVLNFGLADADSVEFIRILWPGGVRQTELATASAQRLHLTELNRKGTSCPILYAWDGAHFRFVSDFLGGAIIGYPIAPGRYNTPDTDEYLLLGPIAPRRGRYTLQIANQLEEIIYLDAAHIIAADHPAELAVFPNERLLSQPPFPEFSLYSFAEFHRPKAAVDHRGDDVLDRLLDVDDRWYDSFAATDIHGYSEEHSLTFEMGDLSNVAWPVLLLNGWVDYAHSTSNWAAFQREMQLFPPQLEVGDGSGGWRLVTEDMGSPAGLPKHMLFDLKDQFAAGDYRLRITTNASVYLDQILVGSALAAPVEIHRHRFDAADLHWRGYPAHTAINGTFAFRYHYDRVNPYSEWGSHDGPFTRYGEVTDLLRQVDDRYVILFHGDEITLELEASAFPELKPGWQRTFLFYADGFGKDMDFHSARSLTVGPFPFHSMSSYPYPDSESYPHDSRQHMEYMLEYNTRWVQGSFD